MNKRGDSQASLVAFLTEFAKYLIAAGISAPQFEDASRLAFFRAASVKARLGNSKINQSAVAAMTGLTRTQVRTLLRTPTRTAPRHESRVEQIVTGWLTDPVFTTSSGNARILPLTGRRKSFVALARKYGGDITPRALRSELMRQGFIRVHGDRISLSKIARRSKEPTQLSHLAGALAKVIGREAKGSGAKTLKLLSTHVTYETPSSAGRILFQRRISQGLRAFATDVESAGAAIAKTSKIGGKPSRMSRTSFLLVSHD